MKADLTLESCFHLPFLHPNEVALAVLEITKYEGSAFSKCSDSLRKKRTLSSYFVCVSAYSTVFTSS